MHIAQVSANIFRYFSEVTKNEKIFIFLLDKLIPNLYNIFIFKDVEGNKIHIYSAKRAIGWCEIA